MYIFVSIGVRCQLGRKSCSFLLSRIVLYVLIFFRKYYVNSDKFITLHYITIQYQKMAKIANDKDIPNDIPGEIRSFNEDDWDKFI